MANIAKNIRRLRTEQQLTQDQLAEKIVVTRQTVSSWETGRTEPDIQMLEQIAQALDTDLETLIYGKKRRFLPKTDEERRHQMLVIVLTILGLLLTAVGVGLVLIFLWQYVGRIIKITFSFFPLLASFYFVRYVFRKKPDVASYKEGASVLWIAGVILTNLLVSVAVKGNFGFAFVLFADILLTLPIMFVMQSAFAMTATVIMTILFYFSKIFSADSIIFSGLQYSEIDFSPVFWGIEILLLLCCAFFGFHNRLNDVVKRYAVGLTIFAVIPMTVYLLFLMLQADNSLFLQISFDVTFFVYCVSLFCVGKTKKTNLPVGAIGLIVYAFELFSQAFHNRVYSRLGFEAASLPWSEITVPVLLRLIFVFALCTAAILFSYRYGKERLLQTRGELPLMVVMLAAALLSILLPSVLNGLLVQILSLAFGILLTVFGVLGGSRLRTNLGIVNILADMFLFISWLAGTNLLIYGLLLLASGVVLLVANLKMQKKFAQKKDGEEAETEVLENA